MFYGRLFFKCHSIKRFLHLRFKNESVKYFNKFLENLKHQFLSKKYLCVLKNDKKKTVHC